MSDRAVPVGVVIDDTRLEDLVWACGVSADWLHTRPDAGLLSCCSGDGEPRRFASPQLQRARQLLAIERDFDANQELAALVADRIDEVHRLRAGR